MENVIGYMFVNYCGRIWIYYVVFNIYFLKWGVSVWDILWDYFDLKIIEFLGIILIKY